MPSLSVKSSGAGGEGARGAFEKVGLPSFVGASSDAAGPCAAAAAVLTAVLILVVAAPHAGGVPAAPIPPLLALEVLLLLLVGATAFLLTGKGGAESGVAHRMYRETWLGMMTTTGLYL